MIIALENPSSFAAALIFRASEIYDWSWHMVPEMRLTTIAPQEWSKDCALVVALDVSCDAHQPSALRRSVGL